MSILDDAIREHLELKRQHGADESELKRLEDEAFGPPVRPDGSASAEAPTEFVAAETSVAAEPGEEEGGRRRINIADLQEPPPPEPSEPEASEAAAPELAAPESPESPDGEISEAPEPPEVEISEAPESPQSEAPLAPAEDPVQMAAPVEEESPSMDHDAIAEPPAPEAEPEAVAPEPAAEPDERQAIADQPTELFDVEAEMGSEDAPAAEAPSPSDDEIVEAEREEPRLVPVADEDEEDEEFWSEQRLSDELDQALEAPITDEHEAAAPTVEPAAPVFGREGDEEGDEDDEYEPEGRHEDVLEDTPDFLEDAPEDDELWFEQRPPKDFDFDD